MPLDNNPPGLTQVLAATGQKACTLAFVLAQNNSTCAPAWDGGAAAVSSGDAVTSQINARRAAGGEVSVWFCGYGGINLGQVCGHASATAAAEQLVINAYGLHALDFDLEEPEIENSGADRQRARRPSSAPRRSSSAVTRAFTSPSRSRPRRAERTISASSCSTRRTASASCRATLRSRPSTAASAARPARSRLRDFNTQLMSTFGWSSATADSREGVSSMNGRTDSAEYFYQSDFQQVLSFAGSSGMPRYTFWSANRDRERNPPGNSGSLSGTCSSVAQNDWDFTRFTAQFAGAPRRRPRCFHDRGNFSANTSKKLPRS